MRPSRFRFVARLALSLAVLTLPACGPQAVEGAADVSEQDAPAPRQSERRDDPPRSRTNRTKPPDFSHTGPWIRGTFESVQVNVDDTGQNIWSDAANEPSIVVDPTDPLRIVIGWRQFDSIESNFRQGGWGYSHDSGRRWTFPGVVNPGEFASDPVLDVDVYGNFYYYSLQPERGPGEWACYLYSSDDGGVSWPDERYAWGGDKAWMAIDRTAGMGQGNIYLAWNPTFSCCGEGSFTRSTDGGLTFMDPIRPSINPRWGTITVGPNGVVYVVSAGTSGTVVAASANAQDPDVAPTFNQVVAVDLGGVIADRRGPNPGGLLGQAWIVADHSDGPTAGHLYLLGSVDPPGDDPLDVMIARSQNGGWTWSDPVRVNDDPADNGAWQWFATLSVAPTGRLDVIFNDTRNDPSATLSELYYTSSEDGGRTWSTNTAVSPAFDASVGYPQQEKIGDYYGMISDAFGADVAYAATFNGEQDVYYLRIGPRDCNRNSVADELDVRSGFSADCDANLVPDECQLDCNENGSPDACDISDNTSTDCSGNDVPDECEADCNSNRVADSCDILNGVSEDCDGNLIPDECDFDCDLDGIPSACDVDEDRDDDGIDDCVDRCPDIAPALPCVCPELGICCFQVPFCIPDYDLALCVEQGGVPDCQTTKCREGCLMGDADEDGAIDLRDVDDFLNCHSGESTTSGFIPPVAACLDLFDFDDDSDVDGKDFASLVATLTGP